jgi:hypothetical protein
LTWRTARQRRLSVSHSPRRCRMAKTHATLPRREGVHDGPLPRPLAVRFWAKVNKRGPVPKHRPDLGRCWVWTASTAGGGYGKIISEGGRTGHLMQAHHFLWIQKNGRIPKGKELDHLCRNRACIRDSHLEAVTRRINLLRGVGFVAKQAAQTKCIHGHPFNRENTYRHRGHRYCRTCRRERVRDYQRRHGEN